MPSVPRPDLRVCCATLIGKALLGVDADPVTALRPGDVEAERLPERHHGVPNSYVSATASRTR